MSSQTGHKTGESRDQRQSSKFKRSQLEQSDYVGTIKVEGNEVDDKSDMREDDLKTAVHFNE